MATIALEGVHFHANHGFYEEEQLLGNDFVVDVYVETDFSEAAESDDLFATLNYETIFLLCQMEMKKPAKLLEHLAQRIIDKIHEHFEGLLGVKVRLRKLNPPLGGRVDSAFVEVKTGIFGIPSVDALRMLSSLAETLDELENL